MQYQVLCDGNVSTLQKMVNNAITHGWEPIGGVAIGEGYFQAMIRREQRETTIPFPQPITLQKW